MASSLNKIMIIGNLTADPQVKETPTGQKVATFSVATSRKWKDASGVIQEDTEFHNVVAWRKLAEIIEEYVVKGMKCHVEGYLKTRTWEKEVSGEIVKMYRTEIIAENFIMLGSKGGKKKEDEKTDDEFSQVPQTTKKKISREDEVLDISDIPF